VHEDIDFSVKAADADAGSFTGYASIFGNVDLGGDVVLPGAFKEFETNAAGEVLAKAPQQRATR
jgi:phage head maturation protease